MERVSNIQHKGKDIIYLDFSNLSNTAQINELIKKSAEVIRTKPPNSVLTLTNVIDMNFNTEVTESFKKFAADNKPYVRAGSVVGITGLKRIVYNAVMKFSGRDIIALDNLEAAKDWLAQK